MIARSAVKAWLDRPLRRLSRMKELSPDEVKRRVALLDPPPHFHTVPYHHQLTAFLAATRYDSLMVMFGLGLGKTKTIYDIVSDKIACGVAHRVLVLVPTVTVCGVWEDEARIHAPHLKVQVIDGSGRDARLEQINSDAAVVVVTYQGMLALCSKSQKSARNSRKNRWVLDPRADKILRQFDVLVCDESTAIKSYDSLYFYMVRKIAGFTRFRYCLTGTPFGSDPQDLWSQYYVLDFGETLGASLGLLREACFTGTQGYFGGTEWKLKKTHQEDIRRFLDHSTLRYDEKECLDLPSQVFQTIHVPAPPDLQQYYDRIVRDFREAHGDVTVMQNVFVLMRQLTSGFMTGRDEHTDKIYSDFDNNPKLDATEDLIRALPEGKKMVIFHTYVHTGELIRDRVEKIGGIDYERVWGGATQKAKRIDRFRTDPNCRLLVLNDQAGALGLNLQAANFVLFYECPCSPIIRQQAEKRCHRAGQTGTVYYYDLVMRHTVDERILSSVRAGKDLMEELLGGRTEL